MNNYTIRLATIDDIKRIQELSQELMEHEKKNATREYLFNIDWALTEKGYQNYKSNIENDWIYVVCIDDTIVGYMTCWIIKKKPWTNYDVVEIGNLYIQDGYRGKGIGTELINEAKKLCKDKDIKYLKVDVLEDSKEAQKFYQKNGLYKYSIEQYAEIQ